jgi:hypothetical protein
LPPQKAPNNSCIIARGLRVNIGALERDGEAVPYLELRLQASMRLSPASDAAVLQCEQPPALRLYGGLPAQLVLAKDEELVAALRTRLTEEELREAEGSEEEEEDRVSGAGPSQPKHRQGSELFGRKAADPAVVSGPGA